MKNRKEQILEKAIEIIVTEGYGKLTMRALARASGIKLGALQYHYATWEDLLRALAGHITEGYRQGVADFKAKTAKDDLSTIVEFLFDDQPGQKMHSDRLWPQLWAMGSVEPIMGQLLADICAEYLTVFEVHLKAMGSENPRAEALVLMSVIEGSSLFIGHNSQWAGDADAVKTKVVDIVQEKFRKRGE